MNTKIAAISALSGLKTLSHYKVFQYRGSQTMYLTLSVISRAYMAFFAATNYMLIPTPYGKLYLPKTGYSSSRVITYMMDMVEPQCATYFEELVKCSSNNVLVDIGAASRWLVFN